VISTDESVPAGDPVSAGGTITDVPGVTVGHWTDPEAKTGVTVLAFPSPNVAAAEIRGGNPGAREIATLASGLRDEPVDAVVFAGGSSFGLAAADGVMRALEGDDRGRGTADGFRVPLVPALVVYDLSVGDGSVRPGPAQGEAAYRSASSGPVAMGRIGAGTGTTAGNWRGADAIVPGGLGSAAVRTGGATVGALVVLNPMGDVLTLEGAPLTGGDPVPSLTPARAPAVHENTTLVAVATDARLSRPDLLRLIVRGHDALGVCLRPAHTRYDGDAVIAVSCGSEPGDVDGLGEATFVAVGRAIQAALA
jgi:L-aminopeptidase/D-esterase-like protein